jgi:transcription elongation factor Elf1
MKDTKKEKDFIFQCNKCNHNLYVERIDLQKILKISCPNCGEEPDELWTLIGRGSL